MAAGHRHRVHGFLAQFVGELAELAALQAAHVSRRLDEVKERGLGGLGHEERLRRRMGGDNLTGWLKFNQKCCEVLNASRFFHCVRGTWRSAEAFGLYLVAAGGCKACAARACFSETQACELSGGPSGISQETQVRRDPGATGARASSQGKSVRHPKTRRAASAL